jgi:probable F420-dependent oxidoreductase
MVRLTAEIADGLLVMPFNTERHFHQRTLPAMAEGLRRGGRDRSDLTVTAEVIVACGRDEAELDTAMTGARGLLAFYASTPSYRPVLEVEGWEDLQPELNAMSKSGRWAEMPGLLDDAMVSALAVVGSPTDAAAQVQERYGDHVDRIGFYTPYAIGPETLAHLVRALRDGTGTAAEVTPT